LVNIISNPLSEDLDQILENTRDLWEDIRGKRIFITGGTGFFGCWLLESFAWANDRLGLNASALVLTRNEDAFRNNSPHLGTHPAIQFHMGDIRSFDYPPGSFAYIIHAATDSSTQVTIAETIEAGTRHVLDFACQSGVKKFLLTSSGAVYSPRPPEMTHISEEYPTALDPKDLRTNKLLAEEMCINELPGETKIARCFTFIGPRLPLDRNFAVGNFIRDGLGGGPIIVRGDGTPLRSYLYASDLATWLWTILFRGESGRPYNVGSDESLSIAEVADQVAQQFLPHPKVEIKMKSIPGNPAESYVPSVQRAQIELGLDKKIDFQASILNTIKWYRLMG